MFLSRSPLRISLAGGGTDLPSYYKLKGGLVISAAINKYIYVTVNKTWKKNFLLKYSEIEKKKTINSIKHNAIRETLSFLKFLTTWKYQVFQMFQPEQDLAHRVHFW